VSSRQRKNVIGFFVIIILHILGKYFKTKLNKINMRPEVRAKEIEIEAKGLLWSWGNGCKLYCVKSGVEFHWWMFGETGMHMVVNRGLYGHKPYACERVINHWNGFKKNQPEFV
jgi:hypothetical protein